MRAPRPRPRETSARPISSACSLRDHACRSTTRRAVLMRTYLVRMPRCLRTEGAGQLAARRHALYVRGTRTSLGRAERTMYHVPWHHRQPSHRAERLAEHHGVGRAVPRRVRRRGERRVRQRPCGCGHLPAAARLPFAACGHCAPRCGRDPCAVDDGAAGGGGGGAHGARARSQVRRWRRSVLLQRTA